MVDSQGIDALIGVALFWTVAAVSPGPNFFVVVHQSVSGGGGTARRTVLGVVSATLLWGLAGFFGVQALFVAVPGVYLALKLIGGAYIVYLGVKLLTTRAAPSTHPATASRHRAWRRGFLTNLSNPKTAAFVASVFAVNMPPEPSLWLGLAGVAVMVAISLTWYSLVAAIMARSRVRAAYARARSVIDRVAGVVFVAFGLKFALDK